MEESAEVPIVDTPFRHPSNPFLTPVPRVLDSEFRCGTSRSEPILPTTTRVNATALSSSLPNPTANNIPPAPWTFPPGKSESLSKWNISYSGDSCVREFFARVEEEGIARSINPSYVVLRFHELLGGSALKYFRAIRSPSLSYNDLKAAFLRTFGTADYDFKVERQLRALKQTCDQSVVDFVIQIRDLNSKLHRPIDEDSLLTIVKYGLHARYHPCLASNIIKDMDSLLQLSKNFETYQEHTSTPVVVAPVSSGNPPVCLKCNSTGHDYRGCPNVSGTICFKCKLEGYLTRDCPRCNPNKTQKN